MRASIVGLPATEALKSIWLSIGVFQRSRANFWLILATQQDPEPSSKKRGWETYKRSVISGQFGAAALAFALLFVPTQHANAGVASFLVQFFEAQVYAGEEMKISLYNIQNVPILRPALNVDPNPSKGGGDITVVDNSALLAVVGPSGTLADIENRPPQSDQISIYVVREGDSISQIADMFGVSVNTIVWANDLKRGTLITPGQTLVILPITGVQHSVKSGDTLSTIAKKYKGDLDEIASYNDLVTDSKLAVGDTVFVPNGELHLAPSYSPKASGSALVKGASGPSYSGYYTHPAPGAHRSQGLHGYNGVDLAASIGTPVVAAAGGDVIIARYGSWNGGYGSYIVVRHPNGTQTLYSHLNSGIVYTGQGVVQGQVIGYIGQTGRVTGPHLHFEVRGARNPF